MVPKIEANSIAEQRHMRQRQLIDAAMSLALEGGAPSVTVSAVAKRAGISRSLIYEYFSSSADLISDLIMEELENYRIRLSTAVKGEKEPIRYLELWIEEALHYIVDGRHMLVKSLNSIAIPDYRKSDISQGHRALMATIIGPLREIGIVDLGVAVSYLQNSLDAASVRIESGNDPALEVQYVQKFVIAGLRALAEFKPRNPAS